MPLVGSVWSGCKHQASRQRVKNMRRHPNRLLNLVVYDGDWHTRLVTALELARDGTRSKDLLSAIEVFEHQLLKSDTCIHTVTAVQVVPLGMDVELLKSCIEECIDVQPATLQIASGRNIELTITARGSLEHVHRMATSILSSGFSVAKAKMWAELNFRNARFDQHI